MSTLTYLYRHVMPTAYSLLPVKMLSVPANAMLLAIALQESKAMHRRQGGGGPARGFWQFEVAGCTGVRSHRASQPHLKQALTDLSYAESLSARSIHAAVEHNDVLACVCARLLLWTDSEALPLRGEADRGWAIYLRTWRPGKPHPETWPDHFAAAWDLVSIT